MIFALLVWIFCGIGAAAVANTRGANGCLWFGLGVMFGPFGLAFAFASGSSASCNACRKHIHPEATKCPYCQTEVGKAGAMVRCKSCWTNMRPINNRCPKCNVEVSDSENSESKTAKGVICAKCTAVNDANWKVCGQCSEPTQRSSTVSPKPAEEWR